VPGIEGAQREDHDEREAGVKAGLLRARDVKAVVRDRTWAGGLDVVARGMPGACREYDLGDRIAGLTGFVGSLEGLAPFSG
jgi:hypothetical protein